MNTFGKLLINLSAQAFHNVATPQYGAEWTIRLQCQFLFPKQMIHPGSTTAA